ncbi:MAG: hypothetical protein HY747_03495 [Elusimicrobia bacterium]|nr:hypothetical protein [Elusimicrobiota bacterium]
MTCIFAATLAFLSQTPALADGIIWEAPSAQELVAQKAQQAWVEWKDGRERLVIAVNPKGVSPHLAWMLPLPVPAKQAQLNLVDHLPSWPGDEVRAGSHLASHPVILIFYFFLLFIVGGFGAAGAIVLLIIFILSAISIGPGPSLPELSNLEVQALSHVELSGLVSELADTPSVEALERYLKAMSCAFPAPARPWYPVRLTSVYAQVKTPIDLHLTGWQSPEDTIPKAALIGYYQGDKAPRRHTRIVFQGRAASLTQDWTFVLRAKTLDLRLAAMTAAHPFIANALLLLLCSLASSFILGFLVFPDWRNAAGLRPLALLGASGILPFIGPKMVLRRLRPLPSAPPSPLPVTEPVALMADQPHDPKYFWGAAFVVMGAICQALGFMIDDNMAQAITVIGSGILCVAGLSMFYIYKGHPKRTSVITACACAVLLPVIGPILGLLSRPLFTAAPKPVAPAKTMLARWKIVIFGMAAACLFLHLLASSWFIGLWPLDHATVSIQYSGHGFASLIRKANEGATRGNLSSIGSALSAYYDDTQGEYPKDLEALTAGGKYLKTIPPAMTPPYHPNSSEVLYLTGEQYAREELDDSGGWGYVVSGPSSGTVFVNCTHTDTKDRVWSSY